MTATIAYQGEEGAYSHIACLEACPHLRPQGYPSFEDVFAAVEGGEAEQALIPVENSIAGRVAEIHQILAHAELHAIGEHFQPIHHHLLTQKNVPFEQITHAASHMQALAQCRLFLQKHNITPLPKADTAIAARELKESENSHMAAIASAKAAAIYNLDIKKEYIQDKKINITRFLILATKALSPPRTSTHVITSIVFQTKNTPAALYHVLGSFAQEHINLTRLEGMVRDESFHQAAFYIDMEAHEKSPPFSRALNAISTHAHNIRIIGCYKAHPHRRQHR